MADLDDFFAKKDKKKSKAKPKFLTADELVKKLEDTSKREASVANTKPKKPDSIPVTDSATNTGSSGDEPQPPNVVEQQQAPTEEEWKEFEEEQRKDYSGLKIGRLTLNDDEDDSPEEGDDEDGDVDNNLGNETSKRGVAGPWKKVIPAEDVTQIPMEVEKTSTKSSVYISPALRNSGLASATKLKPRNRAAPDITNADYFPTLGASRPEEQRKKKNEPAFEEVRHGGRMQRIQDKPAAPVSVANRFQTLDDDDS